MQQNNTLQTTPTWLSVSIALMLGLGLSACSGQEQAAPQAPPSSEAASAPAASAPVPDQASQAAVPEGADGELLKAARNIFEPLPSQEAVNSKHPVTDAQIALGHQLYFDNRLSKNGNQSCNSCHNLARGGVDNLAFSPGSEFAMGGRNAPTVLNAALQTSQFWDGRAKDLKEQAGGPLLNPIEMGLPNEEAAVNIVKKPLHENPEKIPTILP